MAAASPNLILIGCGPHARRVYLPALRQLSKEGRATLRLVVDLESQQAAVLEALRNSGVDAETLFIKPFKGLIPRGLDERLSAVVERQHVTAVILATEPLVHKAYAKWALARRMHILLDKPITARENAASELESADGIEQDYEELANDYRTASATNSLAFVVNAQRRFHPGFDFVERRLRDVTERTGCPVTFIQSYHCDGQWRFPSEIVTQKYHPYCQGYGKASHSGYHVFDAAWRLYSAGLTKEKRPDALEISSSFIQPAGFLKQLTEADYERAFGPEYHEVRRWSDRELSEMVAGHGEIDLSAIVRVTADGEAVANMSINLLHNGFSRRTWIRPGADLYKGNGRVKHEHHNIQQGPFQNIQIHSYQAKDRHDAGGKNEGGLGGNNHFDVYVFRHPLLGGHENSLDVHHFGRDDAETIGSGITPLAMERVKHDVVREFVEAVNGDRNVIELRSQFEDHATTVRIMSGIYRSHIQRLMGLSPVVVKTLGSAWSSNQT